MEMVEKNSGQNVAIVRKRKDLLSKVTYLDTSGIIHEVSGRDI